MAQSNHERVGKALELLNSGLKPFVEREMLAKYGPRWQYEAVKSLREQHISDDDEGVAPGHAGLAAHFVGPVAHGLQQRAGPRRAQPGQRTARDAQQVGAPESLQQR